METIARQWNTSDSFITDDQIIGSDDIWRAAQASLMTCSEEIARRELTPYPTRHPNHSNQDYDSFDDWFFSFYKSFYPHLNEKIYFFLF